MQSFEISEQRNDVKPTGLSQKSWSLLIITNIVLSVVIVIVTVFLLIGQEQPRDTSNGRTRPHHGQNFLSAAQRERFLENNYRWISLNTTGLVLEDCREVNGDMCLTDTTFHGCCKSRMTFFSPRNITDMDGENHSLLPGQFFPTDNCTSIDDCTMCKCEKTDSTFHGFTKGYKWVWFQYKACCKCF